MNVSVVIASYGDDRWRALAVERALPSAESQGCEVIVNHEPGGTNASSRNGGAERATGDWLCFLDADDELGAGYVAAMRRQHQRLDFPTRVLYTPQVSYVRRRRPEPPVFLTEIPLNQANWLVIGTLIERDLFSELGGFQEWPHGLEDWDLWSRAWKAGATVQRVRRAVYIAHWNRFSAHHTLMRDRRQHVYWHQKVGHANWPERFDAPTPDEDAARRLRGGALRMLV